MNIDLANVGNGIEMSNLESNQLKTSHLYQKLTDINVVNGEGEYFNYIIMPMCTFNLIQDSALFHVATNVTPDREGVYFVGYFGGFKCYVDMLMPYDLITLRYDLQTSRENKLNAILDNIEVPNEINIEIL